MLLGDIVSEIRSKNAGPFWVTIDVFCGDTNTYEKVRSLLGKESVATLYQIPESQLQRYDIENLHVVKFSFPRPVGQGSLLDRDMHGAQYSILLSELPLAPS